MKIDLENMLCNCIKNIIELRRTRSVLGIGGRLGDVRGRGERRRPEAVSMFERERANELGIQSSFLRFFSFFQSL